MKKTLSAWQGVVLLAFLFFSGVVVKAEGSKDLYPTGVKGNRAFLVSRDTPFGTNSDRSWPFLTLGTHYVYVKNGEVLHTASSAQNVGSGRIRLTAPNGSIYTSAGDDTGKITTRTAELAGPSATGAASGDNYSTFNRTATAAQEGIWKVEFIAPGGVGATNVDQVDILANASWTQAASPSALIAAWDISVRKGNSWVSGRVYTPVLNLIIKDSFTSAKAYYGVNYVLTKDGYTYRVKGNGSNGVGFTSFVNNRGFVDNRNYSIYASLNNSLAANVQAATQDPRIADGGKGITHKMFYALPASDLPTEAAGAAPGGTTWLKKVRVAPKVTEISVEGVEGTAGQISSKGGNVIFTADRAGGFEILIKSTDPAKAFSTRTIKGSSNEGENKIFWDGKDGDGNSVPQGTVPIEVTVTLQGGEVHFPYIDMEINPAGIVIELYNTALSGIESDIVYWDDTPVTGGSANEKSNPVENLTGLSSNTNGHKWGTYSATTGNSGNSNTGSYSFGNEKSMDTWTFVKGSAVTIPTSVIVLKADLAVTSLTADKTNAVPGDLVTFTVTVKNNGPDAANGSKFVFTLPAGFTGGTASFNGNTCGTQTTAVSYDSSKNTYSATLNLPNGCEVTYTITATAGAPGASSAREVKASVLRPNDVTDPDATNTNSTAPPGTAEQECANNGLTVACNNIKTLDLNVFCEISSRNLDVADNNLAEYVLPPTDVGYQFDIRNLDNSFNLEINGTKILSRDIQFSSGGTSGINIGFEDGTRYETPGINSIWTIVGTNEKPVIRVIIGSAGNIKLYGSKVSQGPLFPLVLLNSGTFTPVTIYNDRPNVIKITQEISGPTYIRGRIYGAKTAPCVCFDAANTTGTAADTQVGITTLQRAGTDNGNWPMVRKSGHIALESNDKGFVITRMTTAQINAIPTPVDGMMVFDTTANCLKIHNGSTWKCFSTPACL